MNEIITLTTRLLGIISDLEMNDAKQNTNVELVVRLQNNLLDELNIHSPLTINEQVIINVALMNALKKEEQAALN